MIKCASGSNLILRKVKSDICLVSVWFDLVFEICKLMFRYNFVMILDKSTNWSFHIVLGFCRYFAYSAMRPNIHLGIRLVKIFIWLLRNLAPKFNCHYSFLCYVMESVVTKGIMIFDTYLQ
jgi:hypothetical protein